MDKALPDLCTTYFLFDEEFVFKFQRLLLGDADSGAGGGPSCVVHQARDGLRVGDWPDEDKILQLLVNSS